MDPAFSLARAFLFYALLSEGKFQEALDEIERGQSPDASPATWLMKTYLYGQWGRTGQAQHAFAKFERLAPQLHDRTLASILAYVGMGRKDRAIALLQKAYSERSNGVTGLKVDPRYDPLRGDARFQDLLRRLGLAQ